MFVVYPSNIDHLIADVRLHIGDTTEPYNFSDSLIRTALINAVKSLQRKWKNRYIVFNSESVVSVLPYTHMYFVDYVELNQTLYSGLGVPNIAHVIPSGFVLVQLSEGIAELPSGLKTNDVCRNPFILDDATAALYQEDEYPVVLQAAIILRRAYMTNNAENFSSWSDGEYSYSTIAAGANYRVLLERDIDELDMYFKRRLAPPIRAELQERM